jgi:hypothetical protein
MKQQVTQAQLQSVVDRINRITGSPAEPYTKNAEGKHIANIGNYYLDGAYGGYSLHRMVNAGAGANDILSCGYVPKRELLSLMFAYIQGLSEVAVK